MLSKRRLTQLVEEGRVEGWNDPRMPTICGLRRRGVPAAAIRDFVGMLAISKTSDNLVEAAMLDHAVRERLNKTAPRRFGVLRLLKLVIENYPEGESEFVDALNNPEDPDSGTRPIPFGRTLYVEADDFLEDPPKKFFRLAPGREARLRYAYLVTCREAVKDSSGAVTELRCTYDPATRGGQAPDGRKVRGALHWVSAADSVAAEVRLYDSLFTKPIPGADGGTLWDDLNPESRTVLTGCRLEPSLADTPLGETVQFERQGYFCPDPVSTPERPVFNRTVGLRDSWARAAGDGAGAQRVENGNHPDGRGLVFGKASHGPS